MIIVMISIFTLSILAGGFAYSMKVETRLARNANSETELEWLGRSAVQCACWELGEAFKATQGRYDSEDLIKGNYQSVLEASNSVLVDFKREIHAPMGDGSATWTITDLESKANINTANEVLLQQALMVMGVDAGDMTPIVSSILDWIDPDDNTHPQGAESDYYQSLDPPYYAKNGPIDDLSELLLIKGINQDLYFGPASTNHPISAVQAQLNHSHLPNQPVAYTCGLVDLFTPLSDGKININTASAQVLQLIPGIDPAMAEAIVNGRAGEDDGSGLLGPYRSVQQVNRLPELGGQAGPIVNSLNQFCDVRSKTFQVEVDAQVAGYHRRFIAVVGRNNPRNVQVLTFYWK